MSIVLSVHQGDYQELLGVRRGTQSSLLPCPPLQTNKNPEDSGERAQQVKALATKPLRPSSIPGPPLWKKRPDP